MSVSEMIKTEKTRVSWIHLHATWLPRNIFGRFHVVCANIRCLWLVVSSTGTQLYLKLMILYKDCGSLERLWFGRCLDFGSGNLFLSVLRCENNCNLSMTSGSTAHFFSQLFRSKDNFLLSFS